MTLIFPNPLTGHGTGLHTPDKTNSEPIKAMRMAEGTFDALVKYGRQRGCKCVSSMTSDMADDVWRFSILPGAFFPSLITIDDKGNSMGYLSDKKWALDVPNRIR